MADNEFKYAVEALLFTSDKPLQVKEIKEAFDGGVSEEDVSAAIGQLREEYALQARGFKLLEIAGGFQLATDSRFAPILKKFYQAREKKKLSRGAIETLAIIAYKQPVTRAAIEFIRGVQVDGALRSLLEKTLIRVVGRKEVPGRPLLYGTTQEFLEYFGLKSTEDLPALTEFTEKDLSASLLPPEMKATFTDNEAQSLENEQESSEVEPLSGEEQTATDQETS